MSIRPSIRLLAGLLAATGAAWLAAVPAWAVEYVLRPFVISQTSWDDNIQLTSTESREVETAGFRLRPGASLTATGSTWRLQGSGSLDFFKFEEDNFDTNDGYFNFNALQTDGRTRWQFEGDFSQRSVRTTELEVTGGFALPLVQATDLTRILARPSWSWQIDNRNSLTAGATYQDSEYESLAYSDYEVLSADIGFSHVFSERSVFDVSVFANDYEAEQVQPECVLFGGNPRYGFGTFNLQSDTVGARFGGRYAFTERTTLSGSVGWRNVQSTGLNCQLFGFALVSETDEDGLVFAVDWNYAGERFDAQIKLDRTVTPAGLGFLLESYTGELDTSYRLTERLTIGATARRLETDAVADTSDYFRDYTSFEATAQYFITRQFRIGGLVRHRWQEASYNTNGQTAEGTSLILELRYTPQARQFSR